MTIANTSTPVTVLPSPHHGGLGITRSLGRLGISVFNVDGGRWCPSFFSRYSKGKLHCDLDALSGEQAAQWLLKLGQRIGARSILMPTTDGAARFLADHALALREQFIFPEQNPELVHSLSSKKEMHCLAHRCQIPTPATLFPQTRTDFLATPHEIGLPLMVKGIRGDSWNRASKSKVLVRTTAQFLKLYEVVSDAAIPDLIVQEYVPGNEDTVWMFNGYFDRNSVCLAGFTGRKVRQCPIYTGVASLAVCEKNEPVENSAKTFMKALKYSGIVDIDFRYDARDGKYKILDVNSRIGSTFRLFVSETGMDVARAQYLDLTGQDVPASRTVSGRKWMVEDLDLVASFRYRREGSLTLREWWRSLRAIDELSFLAWDDPLPAALMLRADVRELFSRTGPHAERIRPFELKCTPSPAEKQPCL
jgi:D-aspartate ligase